MRIEQLRKLYKQSGGNISKVMPKNIKPKTAATWIKRVEKMK